MREVRAHALGQTRERARDWTRRQTETVRAFPYVQGMNRLFAESLEPRNLMGSASVQRINRAFAESLESRNILVSSPLHMGTAVAGKTAGYDSAHAGRDDEGRSISKHVVGALDAAWKQERLVEASSARQRSEDTRTPQRTPSPLHLSPPPGALLRIASLCFTALCSFLAIRPLHLPDLMAIPVIHFGGPPDEQGPWHPASRGGAAPAQPARGGAVTPAEPDRKTFYPRSRSEHKGTHYKLTIQALRQESPASLSLDAGAAAESKSPAADSTSHSSSVPGQSLPPAESRGTTGLSRVAGRAGFAAKPPPKRNQPEKATPTSSWMQVHARWKQSAPRRCTRSTVAPLPFSTSLIVS